MKAANHQAFTQMSLPADPVGFEQIAQGSGHGDPRTRRGRQN
jgi:hypothetical protein